MFFSTVFSAFEIPRRQMMSVYRLLRVKHINEASELDFRVLCGLLDKYTLPIDYTAKIPVDDDFIICALNTLGDLKTCPYENLWRYKYHLITAKKKYYQHREEISDLLMRIADGNDDTEGTAQLLSHWHLPKHLRLMKDHDFSFEGIIRILLQTDIVLLLIGAYLHLLNLLLEPYEDS